MGILVAYIMCFIYHVCIDRYVEKYALAERFRTVLLCRSLKPGERFRTVLRASKLKNGSERFRTVLELLPVLSRIERNGSERFHVFSSKKVRTVQNGSRCPVYNEQRLKRFFKNMPHTVI